MEAMIDPNIGVLAIAGNFVLCFISNGAPSAVAHRSFPAAWSDCAEPVASAVARDPEIEVLRLGHSILRESDVR
jgi:hypothetical protein